MTITLSAQEEQELWDESDQETLPVIDPDTDSKKYILPRQLGTGFDLNFELYPECKLRIANYQYRQDVQLKWTEGNYSTVHLSALLSGIIVQRNGEFADSQHTLILGGGMWQQASHTCLNTQPHLCIWLELSPERFTAFFSDQNGELPVALRFLVKNNDWQTPLHLKTNAAIQRVAREIIDCPYQGAGQRLYLQGKSHELMALMLMPIVSDQNNPKPPSQMKSTTIAQLYEARHLLQRCLENPPSLLELAQQLGLSDRTLQKGFRSLFGTTMFHYLTEQRMAWAAQQLRETTQTVSEVANLVGYANPAKFAAAFKRQFGITPSDCARGKK